MSLILSLNLLLPTAPNTQLPTEADFNKAQEKLKSMPEDPEANTIAGKYLAFVLGDYAGAMPLLVKSSDQTLKTLAEHERTPLYTDTYLQKVSMGDEWVSAAKKVPALTRPFFDRASQWYIKAWPDLDPLWKAKAREQGAKMAAARPPGAGGKRLPGGWISDMGAAFLDGTVARTGSYSVRMPGGKSETYLSSDPIRFTGKTIEYSAWVRSDGTDSPNDVVKVALYDQNRRLVDADNVRAPMDTPFWIHVTGKRDAIPDAVFVTVGAAVRSGKGNFWVDDLSIKIDGKEILLKNSSFEEK